MKSLAAAGVGVILLACTAFSATGPVDRGSYVLGGSIYYQVGFGDMYEDSQGNRPYTALLAPSFGYFVAPGLLIGANLGYSWHSFRDAKRSATSIGPELGYFFDTNPSRSEIRGAIYPYLSVFYLYTSYTDENHSSYGGFPYHHKNEWRTTNLGAQIGFLCMVSEAVAINVSARMVSDRIRNQNTDADGGTLIIGAGITAFVY